MKKSFCASPRGSCLWDGWRPAGIAAALALCLVPVVFIVVGCSDRSRRMSEGEALQYKRQLILRNPGQISPGQMDRLGFHSARTQAEIDGVFETLREEYAAERKASRVELEEERKRGAPAKARDIPP